MIKITQLKANTFEAYFESEVKAIGQGASKESAISALKDSINQLKQKLDEIDYSDVVEVDAFGREL